MNALLDEPLTAVRIELIEPAAAPSPVAQQLQAQASEAGTLIQVIAAAARDPQVDIEKMERLWVMHESMKNRAAEEAFNDAMNRAQSEMGPISADATNNQTKSRYASYSKLDTALRPIYTKHGFSISYDTGEGAPDGYVRVLAYVSRGGHTRRYHSDIPADGKGAKGGDVMTKTHATGSANSYGMRYLLKMVFNVAVGECDDDGNGAGGKGNESAGAGPITEKIFDGLMADLKRTTKDADAALLWASGSKTLAATGRQEAYQEFKAAVVAHRNYIRDGRK